MNRSFLWQKLLKTGVNGKIISVVQDMYFKAKSCVRVNGNVSCSFPCSFGLRQGENLSPLMYAIYLNDVIDFIAHRTRGLVSLEREAQNVGMSADESEILLRMFILLYADDTVLCAESAKELQTALDALSHYCNAWDIVLNTDKTKVIVFSRGKIRNKPDLKFNGD